MLHICVTGTLLGVKFFRGQRFLLVLWAGSKTGQKLLRGNFFVKLSAPNPAKKKTAKTGIIGQKTPILGHFLPLSRNNLLSSF